MKTIFINVALTAAVIALAITVKLALAGAFN
jgi:hypothetical protein